MCFNSEVGGLFLCLSPIALHPNRGRVDAHKRLFSWTESEMADSFQESSCGRLDGGRGQLADRNKPIKQARVGISHLFS